MKSEQGALIDAGPASGDPFEGEVTIEFFRFVSEDGAFAVAEATLDDGSAMPLVWAHAEFVKLLVSRQINRPFDRPRATWQRYRGRPPAAQFAFWWPHAPVGAIAAGARLVLALPEPAVVHWGRDGWQMPEDTATVDTGLGFHVAVLSTAALPAGSRIQFTWRRPGGEWAGRDITVQVVAEVLAPAAC